MSEDENQSIEEQKQEDAAKASSREGVLASDKTEIGGTSPVEEGDGSGFQGIVSGGDDPRAAFGPNTDLGASGPSREDYTGPGMISEGGTSTLHGRTRVTTGEDSEGRSFISFDTPSGWVRNAKGESVWVPGHESTVYEDGTTEGPSWDHNEADPPESQSTPPPEASTGVDATEVTNWFEDTFGEWITGGSGSGGSSDPATDETTTSPAGQPVDPDSGVGPSGTPDEWLRRWQEAQDLAAAMGKGPKGGENINPGDQDTGSGRVDPNLIDNAGQQAQRGMVGQPADPDGTAGGGPGGEPTTDPDQGWDTTPDPNQGGGGEGGGDQGDLPPGRRNPEDSFEGPIPSSPGDTDDVPRPADGGGDGGAYPPLSPEAADALGSRVNRPGLSEGGFDLKEHAENVQEQIDARDQPGVDPSTALPRGEAAEDNGPIEPNPAGIGQIQADPTIDQIEEVPGTPIDPVPLDAEAFRRATGVNPEEDRLADDPRDFLKPALPVDEIYSGGIVGVQPSAEPQPSEEQQDPSSEDEAPQQPVSEVPQAGEPVAGEPVAGESDGTQVPQQPPVPPEEQQPAAPSETPVSEMPQAGEDSQVSEEPQDSSSSEDVIEAGSPGDFVVEQQGSSSEEEEVTDGGPDPTAPPAEEEAAPQTEPDSLEEDPGSEESQDSSGGESADLPDYPVPDPPPVASGAEVDGESGPPPVGSDPGLVAEVEAPPIIYTAEEVYEVGENPPPQEEDSFDVKEHLGLETLADDPREQVTGPPLDLLADTETEPPRDLTPNIANPKPFEIDPGVVNAINHDPSEEPNEPSGVEQWFDENTVDAEEFERATGVNPEEDRLADDPRDFLKPAVPPELLADTQAPSSASDGPPSQEQQGGEEQHGQGAQEEVTGQQMGLPAGYVLGGPADTGSGPSGGVEEWGGVPLPPEAEEPPSSAEPPPIGERLADDPRDYLAPGLPSDLVAATEEDHTAEQGDTLDDAGI